MVGRRDRATVRPRAPDWVGQRLEPLPEDPPPEPELLPLEPAPPELPPAPVPLPELESVPDGLLGEPLIEPLLRELLVPEFIEPELLPLG